MRAEEETYVFLRNALLDGLGILRNVLKEAERNFPETEFVDSFVL